MSFSHSVLSAILSGTLGNLEVAEAGAFGGGVGAGAGAAGAIFRLFVISPELVGDRPNEGGQVLLTHR